MIPYIDLHPAGKIIIQTFLMIVMLKLMFLTVSIIFSTRKKRLIISSLAAVCICAFMLVLFMSEYKARLSGIELAVSVRWLLNVPAGAVVFIGVGLFVASTVADILHSKYKKRFITIASIKEAVDNLSVGLCFSNENGVIRFANYKIGMLCKSIFNLNLQNAEQLWQKLQTGDVSKDVVCIKNSDTPIVILPDKTTWIFTRNFIEVDKERCIQIIAIDISELHKLQIEIEDQNEKLKSINKNLREYSKTIEALTRQEEIFETKVRVHDDMGKALLASKRLIKQGSIDISYKELMSMWQSNVNLLHNEAKPKEKSNEFERLETAAKAIGVKLNVNGDIPFGNKKIVHIIVSAARECLTNTVRHAGGDELTINIVNAEGAYNVEYTNNGEPPLATVKEGGGLSSLRRLVEQAAGSMDVVSAPAFKLMLAIPEERSEKDV